MKFEIRDKKKRTQFIYIFNYLKNITDRLSWNVSPEMLYIQGMDSSHICIYELFLKKSWFDVWDVSENKTYGLSLAIFNKIMHICSDKQTIIISDESVDKLNIQFISEEKGEFNKFFEIPLMEIDEDMLSIPEQDYEVDIKMESKKFKSVIDELFIFNDVLNIVCNESEIILESESTDGNMKAVITSDDIEMLAIVENTTIKASFGIKYISHMCQFYKLSESCIVHLSENTPIMVKYDLGDECLMRFYLAPKIGDDD